MRVEQGAPAHGGSCAGAHAWCMEACAMMEDRERLASHIAWRSVASEPGSSPECSGLAAAREVGNESSLERTAYPAISPIARLRTRRGEYKQRAHNERGSL